MPFFKSTYNIFHAPWEDEVFNENWMDSNVLIVPETQEWDYKREMQIEDVDIWEEIYFESGGTGLYAAYKPYAEFYLIIKDIYLNLPTSFIETFYGSLSARESYYRAIQLGMPIHLKDTWVPDEKMWLYTEQSEPKKIILP